MASSEQLRVAAPTNLADGLNQLPAFSGSTKTSSPSTTNSRGGSSGQNLLNLRGLGAQRTLILLDGRRLPATNSGGSVDINIIPQGLVSRVDVVTGGASAAYGSDAVAGVVNFVLDTKLKGFKANAPSRFVGRSCYSRSFARLNMGGRKSRRRPPCCRVKSMSYDCHVSRAAPRGKAVCT